MVLAGSGIVWLAVGGILALVTVLLYRRHLTGLSSPRVAAILLLRIVAIACLVLALARPLRVTHPRRTVEVAVVDISSSLSDGDLATMESRLKEMRLLQSDGASGASMRRMVAFDREARALDLAAAEAAPGWLSRLRRPPNAPSPSSQPTIAGSALADAMNLAAGLIAEGDSGRIILFTDGLATGGDAVAAAMRIGRRNVRLDLEPCGLPRVKEIVLQAADLPGEASLGATIPLRVRLDAGQAGPATLTVVSDGDPSPPIRIPLSIRAGMQEQAFPIQLDRSGLRRFRVRCDADWDTDPDNNELTAATFVLPAYGVACVEAAAERPATRALAGLLGLAAAVTHVPPETLDRSDFSPESFSLLVIADTPADRIPTGVQQRIRQAVRRGLGVLFVGGRQSFGPGGYRDSELAEIMPVDFEQQMERRDPSVTLVIIIDTSGSMKGPRVDLAKEVARLAVRRLQPHDKVGIVEFYGAKRWAARIQSAANAIDINRALNRLSAGGGTVILPAIEEAHYALLNVQTRTKHVLIITDGGVETGPFQAVITRMADAGITASTVMVGPGPYSTFLSSLAHWGGGRFYAAPDRFNLPEIILKQPENLPASPFVEQATRLKAVGDDVVLADVDFAAAPPVDGYVRTVARSTADVLIRSDRGDPVLARWRYGRGFVAALTTDLGGPWSATFARWPDAARLLSNLNRQIAAPVGDRSLRMIPVVRPAGIEVAIDYVGSHASDLLAPLDVNVTLPGGDAREWTIDPLRPGRWNCLIPADAPGVYEFHARVHDGREKGSAAVAVSPPREVSAVAPARALLAGLQQVARQHADGREPPPPTAEYSELWPYFTLAAIALLLLNVLVRRWPMRGGRATVVFLLAAMLLPSVRNEAAETTPRHAAPTAARSSASSTSLRATTRPVTTRRATTRPTAGTRPGARNEHEREAAKLIDAALAGESFEKAVSLVQQAEMRLAEHGLDAAVVLSRIEEDRGNSGVQNRLRAYVAAKQGHLKAAREALEQAVSAGHADAALWIDLGRCLELLGEDAQAIQALDRAIAATTASAEKRVLQLRRAGLLFDTDQRDEARRALRKIAEDAQDSAGIQSCAYLAGLHDEPQLAASLLRPGKDAQQAAREWLLKGLFASRAGLGDEAARCFEEAISALPLARERQFALQQLVSVSRRRGELGALADRWLRDSKLPADRLRPLLNVLRELGRVDEALSLLDRAPASPACRAAIEDARFQEEVVATAIEAGRLDSAEHAFLGLIRQTGNDPKWRVALARLRLSQGRRPDAAALLQELVPGTSDTEGLFRIADAARELSLDDVARTAVAKAAQAGPSIQVRAGLWRAELAEKRGDVAAAAVELEQVVPTAKRDPATMRQLADAFERYGRTRQAIEMLRLLVDQTGDAEAQLRLAWLLEQNQQIDQARELWRSIWLAAPTAARKREAAARLLDLSSKTGTLADLAIALEDKLGQGKADAAEMSLLVDLYTQVGDAVSTGEILFTFAEKGGDEVGALRQLSRAYLRMGQLAQTDATLRRLLVIDPAHAFDYLQELMVLAIERQRMDDADEVIERLAASAGADSSAEEMSAGVFGMFGEHERAARLYRRVLARHPDRVEVWLLWANAMRGAGQADDAIARLQVLAEEADQDDLFLVAIDGLLNLDAGRTPLRSALRRVEERLAAAPDKVFLYDVAADLMDAVGQADHINDRMEQAVVFAGEQRGALLREMMERAKVDGRTDRLISYGNSLIALAYNVPPQVFLDLGEALLAEGNAAEAERAFGRASLLGDYAMVRQKVADAYERALLPKPAQRIAAELLVTDPENVTLLHRNASLLEQLGRCEEAFTQYERALRVLAGRVPRVQDGKMASAPAAARRQRVAANIDEMTQYFDPTIDGLLTAARTDALRARLIDLLRGMFDQELAACADGSSPAKSLGRLPRLARLVSALRLAAFALHAPEAADTMDRALRARFPADSSLASAVVQERVAWGLFEQAAAFVDPKSDLASMPAGLAVTRVLGDPGLFKGVLEQDAVDPNLAFRLAASLVMAGRDGDVCRLLDACEAKWTHATVDTARSMMIVCLAMDEPDRLQRWLGRHIDACRAIPDGDALTNALTDGIRLGWNILTPEQRRGVLARLDRLAGGVQPRPLAADLLRLQLSKEIGEPAADQAGVLDVAARVLGVRPAAIVGVLQWIDAAQRLPLLESAWTACKPTARLELLFAVAGGITKPVGPEFRAGFRRLLEASPAPRLDRHSPYTDLVRSNWHRNTALPSLGVLIAEHLLRQFPNEPAVQVAAASAHGAAGDAKRATTLARQAIDGLFAARKLDEEQQRMIGDIVRLLSRGEINGIVNSVRQAQKAGRTTAIELFAAGAMLSRLDQEEDAVELFSEAFRLGATNEVARQHLVNYLESTGRWAKVSALLEPHLADRAVVQDFELGRLAEAHRLLHDPLGALRVLALDNGPMGAIRTLQLETMLGREDRVSAILRRYLLKNRLERRFYTPFAAHEPLPGGLQEYLARQQPSFTRQVSLFTLLAPLDCAASEFDAMWQCAAPDRRDLPGLVEAKIVAAASRNELDVLARELAARLNDATFTSRDARLLTALATDRSAALPNNVLSNLGRRLAWTEPDQTDTLEAWARLYLRGGDQAAGAAILRWLVAADLAQPRRSVDAGVRLRRLDLYLASLPEARRADERRRILGASVAIPVEPPADRLDAAVLQQLVDSGETELAASALAKLKAWHNRSTASEFLPRVHRACAYAEAVRGNVEGFREHIEELIRLFAAAYGDWNPLDPLQCLPEAGRLKEPHVFVQAIEAAVRAAVEKETLTAAQACHTLALLGQWCAQQNLPDAARRVLTEARALAGTQPSERWLWVIDLADKLEPDVAVRMAKVMLAEGQLPMPRVANVLDVVERAEGRATADRMAFEATRYSDAPVMLERAVRHASASGDADGARKLEQRLRAVTGKPASRPAVPPTSRPASSPASSPARPGPR